MLSGSRNEVTQHLTRKLSFIAPCLGNISSSTVSHYHSFLTLVHFFITTLFSCFRKYIFQFNQIIKYHEQLSSITLVSFYDLLLLLVKKKKTKCDMVFKTVSFLTYAEIHFCLKSQNRLISSCPYCTELKINKLRYLL